MSAAAEPHPMAQFIIQFGLLIVFTRLGGFWFRRWLRLPGVLGELIAGLIIGPYALGHLSCCGLGPLFPLTEAGPVSLELHAIANFAAIILLFLSGLETDLSTFLRYSVAGTIVGIGGVVFSFALGAGCAVWFGLAPGWLAPPALFLGAIATATSVGISARILSERRKMDSPEGVTILAAAVFDDVLGIIVLAIVVGMTRSASGGGQLAWGEILAISAKAFGFWIGATLAGLLLARRFSRMLKYFKSPQAIAALALGFALLLAGLSEMVGLAMIIGAYIMGLSLSRTDLVQVIQKEIEGLHNILVPVFFGTMGMLVDLATIPAVLKVGLVYSLFAVISKVAGCGLPALFCGFNLRGAFRIGAGMLPRGEVALIIAGTGLTSGAIGQDVFGIAILMTLVAMLLGPLMLSGSFEHPASGLRKPEDAAKAQSKEIILAFPSPDMADFMRSRILRAFRQEEFYVYRLAPDTPTYHIRKEDMFFTLECEGNTVVLSAAAQYETLARLVIAEEMLTLRSMLHMAQENPDIASMEHDLVASLFSDDKKDDP
ncbi:MAG TPA: cation:proton antiporter [Kiritimatiellia bacterium]|jgi:Kef-type K+ transport system membrane component KefB|nr:cation:proton antiporter [Kiritimatiellia bacterium]HPC19862.1 cation:proton antiporter [Kiritimatiellia bacterium]HQN80344.1 cation:proton antiporter [Kiritimatiellia bacterium]HQQ61304.1 cation:proton antiporter [Kiritimatiellia bacterium]